MTLKSPEEWKRESQSFDTVAEEYDTYRPGYPAGLVDCLMELSGLRPGSQIVEVGPGTGIATLLLAKRGLKILCIEPGAKLAAVAAKRLEEYQDIRFEICRFEDWQVTPGEFEAVVSAQAFHWVPREIGYAKAARALKPDGSLALFWNMYPGMDGPLKAELDEIYQGISPHLSTPFNMLKGNIQERTAAIETSGYFGPVTVSQFPWSMCYTTQQYLGLLNTYSDHLSMPLEMRGRLYRAVGEAIDRHGGTIERPYVAVLFVAQKLPD